MNTTRSLITSFVLGLLLTASNASAAAPAVSLGSNGLLQYTTDSNGNRIMDFSYAGYEGGGVALPTLPVKATLSPVSGDNTAAIQAAINSVSALTPDSDGFRGAVLLKPGTYNVASGLKINASGVVLRGSGSGSGGTVLNMSGANPYLLLSIAGSGSWTTSGSSHTMTDSYVPSGAMSFHVNSTSGLSVGQSILVQRPVTQNWVDFMGMNDLTRSGAAQTWIAVGDVINTDRVIAGISGTQITLDAPLADSFDSTYLNPPGGSVIAYTFPGRISQVGFEHLSVIAPANNIVITDPQYTGVEITAATDVWVSDVAFQDNQNTVTVDNTAKRVTLTDVRVNHTVTHTGDRMADFGLSGTQIFVDQCSSDGVGEWPLVTQGEVCGPFVVLNFNSTEETGIGPHQRWATGLLADNCSLPNATDNPDGGTTGISYSDRGNHGSGQGWAMGWGIAWNVTTPYFVVQMPPGGYNWCYGGIGEEVSGTESGTGKAVPNGVYVSLGTQVQPQSLYLEQLKERLGVQALANIGYGDFLLSASPASKTVTGGGEASYTATISPIDGFDGSVALSVSGLPSGASGVFTPASISGGSGSSTLNVSTSGTTPAGTYTLTITGADGNLTNMASVGLIVQGGTPVTFTLSPVTFTYNGSAQGPTITPSIAGATYATSGTTSATAAGSYSVTATATGNYTGTSGATAWTITKATPVVSWTAPAAIASGTALGSTQLDATANVPGSFVYTPAAGTVLSTGTQTLSVMFTPADATDYNSASATVSLTVNPQLQAAAPVFSPAAGTYTSAQTVTITSTTSGASIRYTTNGSTPSEANGTVYSGPVSISSTATLQAIAYKSGMTDSNVTSATYTINLVGPLTLEAENLSPVGTGATVSVSDDPNASGGEVEFLNSTAASQLMTLTTPSITAGTYQVAFRYKTNTTRGQHTVKIDGIQVGGTIDQYATTQAYLTTALGNVTFSSTATHTIVLTVTGKNSAATQFYITADSFTLTPVQTQAAAPVFSPGGGSYTSAQSVTITSASSGVSIRYTTDGSTPTETNGTVYSSPVSISATTTLQAIAYKAGFTDSPVTSATYTFGSPPTFNFEAENLSPTGTGATVSISDDPNASGGVLEFLNSTAAGQSMTLTTPSMPAGTYQVQFRYKTNTSRAQHNVKIDGTQVGGTIDQYATTSTYPTATLGNVTFATTGTHTVVLTVTGKDTASTEFYVTADKFTFVGQ